jgi:squalene-associated FAD-dependent desaturase
VAGVTQDADVAVVGGGLAGITAALDCARDGARVTLLEVRPRLGGAAYSFVRDGLTIDNGQHVFLRCCTAYQELLARLGVSGSVTLQDRLDLPVLAPGRAPARLRRTGLPAPLHLAASMARYPHLSPRERAAAAVAMLALKRVDPDDPATDRQAFGPWLRAHRQSAAAIEGLWRLIALPTLNLEVDDASLAQAAQVFQVGMLTDAAAADVGWARVPLSELHDGPARAALERAGVSVRLRSAVRSIAGDGERYELQTPDGPVSAPAVVVALPPERAAKLLPPDTLDDPEALLRLGRSPIVNLHVVYDRPVLTESFAAAVDSPAQWLFDRTAGAGVRDGQYVAVSLSAADDAMQVDPEALRERFVPALAALLPAARDARVLAFHVSREHAATFRASPGARALRPGPVTRRPGLTLAGAWTDTGWPATMEGAVRSGHAAAAHALRTLRSATPAVGAAC